MPSLECLLCTMMRLLFTYSINAMWMEEISFYFCVMKFALSSIDNLSFLYKNKGFCFLSFCDKSSLHTLCLSILFINSSLKANLFFCCLSFPQISKMTRFLHITMTLSIFYILFQWGAIQF
jgi:hypothetical protein